VCHLHANAIISGDIKSHTVLLSLNYRANTCVFGLKAFPLCRFSRGQEPAVAVQQPARARAVRPKCSRLLCCNHATHVCAFGTITWELVTCKLLLHGMKETQVKGLLELQQPPHLPHHLPTAFPAACMQPMKRCWQQMKMMTELVKNDSLRFLNVALWRTVHSGQHRVTLPMPSASCIPAHTCTHASRFTPTVMPRLHPAPLLPCLLQRCLHIVVLDICAALLRQPKHSDPECSAHCCRLPSFGA